MRTLAELKCTSEKESFCVELNLPIENLAQLLVFFIL